MQKKMMLRMLMATLLIASLIVAPVSAAAKEETVNWGDKAYQIIVPGFIEGKDITIDGKKTPAIVVQTPAIKDNNRYEFFQIVVTDPKATMITATVSTMEDSVGDFMADLENGRVGFSPQLYDDFEALIDQPLYLGFSVRDKDFKVIYEFPLWVVFEGAGGSATTTTPAPTTTPTPEPTPVKVVKEVTAASTSSKVIVDGKQIAFEAYTIDQNNYFKLRDLAMAVNGSESQFEVTWDGAKNAINLVSGKAYTPVGKELTPGTKSTSVKGATNQSKIYLDGEEVELTAYTINGNNYFKLRDVAEIFNFGVKWDGTLNQIVIDTTAPYEGE